MIRSTLVVFVVACPTLLAQDSAAFAHLRNPLAAIRAYGIPEIIGQFPNTRLGKLAADEEVAEAVARVIGHMQNDIRRRRETLRVAAELGIELQPWMVANLYTNPDLKRMFERPLNEVRNMEFAAAIHEDWPAGGMRAPDMAVLLSCRPRYEGRWTQEFEREVAAIRRAPWFEEKEGAKIGGYPAYVFTPPEQIDGDSMLEPLGLWFLHLPGTFVYGQGLPGKPGAIEATTAAKDGEVSLLMDLKQYLRMFELLGMGIPDEFVALGFDKLHKLTWRGRFEGELLLDELELQLTDEDLTGLLGALLRGTATPPPQALPKGAIMQLRTAVDLEELGACLGAMADEIWLPPGAMQEIAKALDGGVALGVCAPAPGGLIPRLYLSLGIADEQALDGLLAQFLVDDLSTKKVKYGDVECTIVQIPGAPQGIQPAFWRAEGRLHIAESGRSLRSFLKVQQQGVVAMDVGDAPIPEGPGSRLPTFDLRLDEVQLYRSFRDTWLPMFELVNRQPVAVERQDLPSVDVIEEHCGASRGVLYRDGNRYIVRHLGALGGPEVAAVAMTWGPILTANMSDSSTEQLSARIARHKLEAVWPELESFQQHNKRWPKDLAELFTARKLAPDALLLPLDDFAEDVQLADGTTIKTSFRYFAEPVELSNFNESFEALMVEIRERSALRGFLCKDGSTPEVYSDASSKPIGQFGK